MERSESISIAHATHVLDAVFVDKPLVSEAYSEFDQGVRSFQSPEALSAYIRAQRELGRTSVNLVAYYPEALGQVETRIITLRPETCGGATWREAVEGWGLIQLQLQYRATDTVEFRVAVNTEKRAQAWAQTYPEMGAPSLWSWKLVERHARRLIRVLRNGT